MLSVTNLQTGYGKKHVLHGVSLQVAAGEVVSLLGRNGMGKTTSLRTIMGITKAWGGRIEFDGADITHASSHAISQLGLGYVPEGRGIFPNLTVYENLAISARPGRWTFERVYDLFPRLKERQTHWGNQLSGGEQQMLAIGRALLLNPSMIMLDEVTEGLAPLIQQEIWSCLERVRADGIAILVIDKNIRALLPLVQRHYIIQKGEICWSGTSAELETNRADLDRYITL
ncbi:MAG TPA: ABC transporter ATP-binding protein [Sphingomicrobium sp.]|nr:ABC transporter ATP-binding protein [Sphingomicrobium sp.]